MWHGWSSEPAGEQPGSVGSSLTAAMEFRSIPTFTGGLLAIDALASSSFHRRNLRGGVRIVGGGSGVAGQHCTKGSPTELVTQHLFATRVSSTNEGTTALLQNWRFAQLELVRSHGRYHFAEYFATYPANLCPLLSGGEFAKFGGDFGEAVGQPIEHRQRITAAVGQRAPKHLQDMLSDLECMKGAGEIGLESDRGGGCSSGWGTRCRGWDLEEGSMPGQQRNP